MVTPGPPSACPGTVMHHRRMTADHRFTYPVSQVWLDPDDAAALCAPHRLWSATRPAPVRFRRSDYFDGLDGPIGPSLRQLVAEATGHSPDGPIRMLTQPRTWGWLFNPITVYVLWDQDRPAGAEEAVGSQPTSCPVAAVLEVTNTPWKERHHYAVALRPSSARPGAAGNTIDTVNRSGTVYTAEFDKRLHVSPFLGQHYRYLLSLSESQHNGSPRLSVGIDVFNGQEPDRAPEDPMASPQAKSDCIHSSPQSENLSNVEVPVLTTRLVVDRPGANRATMTSALLRNPLPTHRVSFGIHRQAFALWRKSVRFVAHPKRRGAAPTTETNHSTSPNANDTAASGLSER